MAKILNQKWSRFAPELSVQWPKNDNSDHTYLSWKLVPTIIHITKQSQTLDPNNMDYKNRPNLPIEFSGLYSGKNLGQNRQNSSAVAFGSWWFTNQNYGT